MPEIKLVLTDFDGTVTRFGKHEVSDRVRQAVVACEERGIRMVPVTGRFHGMAVAVLELLGFEDLGVFDNGATIQNCKTGEIIWSKWLDAEVTKKVATILAPASVVIDYSPSHDEHEPADNELERIRLTDQPTSHVFALVDIAQAEKLAAELDKIPDITYYTAPSTRGDEPHLTGFQVNHINADKFHGVEALRGILGIAKEHTLAIGDGNNDISLFKNAAVKVAMGNATEMLKTAADHIVSSVDEDGFAQAMEKFVQN